MHASPYSRTVRYTGALLALCVVLPGCSFFSGGSKLHGSAKGSVYLEEIADWSFEADHPAVIDYATIMKLVKGVTTEDASTVAARMPASGSKPMRVFSDEDAEFLAPLLAQSLSKAKPEERIGFTVSPSAGSGAEPTAGSLYVHEGSIYLSIAPSKNRRVLGFQPGSVARIDKVAPYAAAGATSFVIDYQALAKAPMPTAGPIAGTPKPAPTSPGSFSPVARTSQKQDTPTRVKALSANTSGSPGTQELNTDEFVSKTPEEELRQALEANKMKESEIATLKKEVEWMKKKLRDQAADANVTKANKVSGRPAPKKKTAAARPTR